MHQVVEHESNQHHLMKHTAWLSGEWSASQMVSSWCTGTSHKRFKKKTQQLLDVKILNTKTCEYGDSTGCVCTYLCIFMHTHMHALYIWGCPFYHAPEHDRWHGMSWCMPPFSAMSCHAKGHHTWDTLVCVYIINHAWCICTPNCIFHKNLP